MTTSTTTVQLRAAIDIVACRSGLSASAAAAAAAAAAAGCGAWMWSSSPSPARALTPCSQPARGHDGREEREGPPDHESALFPAAAWQPSPSACWVTSWLRGSAACAPTAAFVWPTVRRRMQAACAARKGGTEHCQHARPAWRGSRLTPAQTACWPAAARAA